MSPWFHPVAHSIPSISFAFVGLFKSVEAERDEYRQKYNDSRVTEELTKKKLEEERKRQAGNEVQQLLVSSFQIAFLHPFPNS